MCGGFIGSFTSADMAQINEFAQKGLYNAVSNPNGIQRKGIVKELNMSQNQAKNTARIYRGSTKFKGVTKTKTGADGKLDKSTERFVTRTDRRTGLQYMRVTTKKTNPTTYKDRNDNKTVVRSRGTPSRLGPYKASKIISQSNAGVGRAGGRATRVQYKSGATNVPKAPKTINRTKTKTIRGSGGLTKNNPNSNSYKLRNKKSNSITKRNKKSNKRRRR